MSKYLNSPHTMFDNIDLGDYSAESLREPIVLVDKGKNKETHIVVSPQYTFEDIIYSAQRLNDKLFQGEWDLYYVDPETKKPIPVSEDAVLSDFLAQNVDTFYWNYKLSRFNAKKNKQKQKRSFTANRQSKRSNTRNYISKNSYASVWSRIAAFLVDIFIISMISTMFKSSFLTLIMLWLYFAGMESSKYQGTLGKILMKLKVTDEKGGRLSLANATGRNLAKGISILIWPVAFFSGKKQGLHDILAKTLVLEEQENGAYVG